MADFKDERIEHLEFENALLRDILDNVRQRIYAIDESDEIILCNRAIEETSGIKGKDAMGKSWRDADVDESVLLASESRILSYKSKMKLTKKPIFEEPHKVILPDGKKMNLLLDVYPFFYKGRFSALYTVGHDMRQIEKFIARTLEVKNKFFLEGSRGGQDGATYFLDDIIGSSEKMIEVLELSRKIAVNDCPVLIIGETGTGKELIAQGIHNQGLYSQGPFVPINCAAIPDGLLEALLFGTVKGAFTGATDNPGLLEQAENGTLFLDEINSMPINLQPKLLRALQEKTIRRVGGNKEIKINCRIISSSNQDIFNQSKGMAIRPDLLYRLATVIIDVPPLRERKQDIQILSDHYIKEFNYKYGTQTRELSNEVSDIFQAYHWPGNIRELQNVIESTFTLIGPEDAQIKMEHIPAYYRKRLISRKALISSNGENTGTLKEIMWKLEKQVIEDMLHKSDWNVSKAAEALGLLRQNLHQKMRHFNISRPDGK